MIARLVISATIALALMLVGPTPWLSSAQQEPGLRIIAMEYRDSDLHALPSLKAHGREFTHLMPRWLHLTTGAGEIDSEIDVTVLREARELGLTVIPVLDNLDGPNPRDDLVRAMLDDSNLRATVVGKLAATLAEHNLGGVDVNFVGLSTDYAPALAAFLGDLRTVLRPSGRLVIVSAFLAGRDPTAITGLVRLIPYVDYARPLIYEVHNAGTDPGPSAPDDFFRATLDAVTRAIPPPRLIAGMSMIGYDWPEQGAAREIDFPRAMALALARNGIVDWEPETGSMRLVYQERGVSLRAYFEDALTLSNKLSRVEAGGLAGVSFERLGAEDPTLWRRLRDGGRPDVVAQLGTVPEGLPFQVIGAGEIWDPVVNQMRAGRREFALDPSTGEVADIHYAELPAPYVIDRTGVPPDGKKIALTFDDGPSAEWSPPILDVLSKYGVPATFFQIGRHAVANRAIVERMHREGHEIGNHTFNHIALLNMSPVQATFELNSTRDIIAGVTERRMRYIRSPFVANPEPRDEIDDPGYFLRPLLVAHDFGYLTVGNILDPRDWERPGVQEIITRATNRSLEPPGHVILLHDSGGDRSQTLMALPVIIEFYQSQGFQFTTISGLLGEPPDFGMPPVRTGENLAILFVAGVLNALQAGESVLIVLMYVSIGIGVTRTVGLMALAIAQYVRRRPARFDSPAVQPLVSVLVPAYNEEKVIGNTIESLLRSNYENYEIIVLDDGSKDGTLAAARKYETHPHVRVIGKENGGKSSALNYGIQLARGEVVIAMDADTVFHPDFIPYVLSHFTDPNVGAASGNAKVGNREDLIANWQSIEYITSFNVDRRAYTLLNCVTVVPGAAGAWRKRDLLAAGGFDHDTLAEDADLTVTVRRLGRRIVYEDRALAWTEAPNTIKGFVKQRRRWSYGSLQMLWKHRDVFLRPKYGALGFVAFPSALLYLTFTLLAPAVDLGAILAVVNQLREDLQLNRELPMTIWEILPTLYWGEAPKPLFYYTIFILIEWVLSAVAFYMDRERPWPLLWVPVQRFVMRWLLYYVLFATMLMALKGFRVGWGKLERKGSALGSGSARGA